MLSASNRKLYQRFVLCLSVAAALAALLVASDRAYARSYEVTAVTFDATVETDGSLTVSEEHSYDFDGSFNGVLWKLPRGTYEGRSIEPALVSAGVYDEDGQLVVFQESDDGEPGTYELSEEDDSIGVKLYWPVNDRAVRMVVTYTISNLATRWADTSELYWQYVPADTESGVAWHNVTATVHLPVPSGEPVKAGENVRAWAHGPLDGELRFEGNDIVFFSPGVGYAEFLEARIAFPAQWLSEAPVSQANRLDTILTEEEQWAKDANAKRLRARIIAYGIPVLSFALGIFAVAFAKLRKKMKLARGPRPTFKDKYYRDVPSKDHPAVLGMLYHNGVVQSSSFTATLMRLADQGRIALDAVWVDKPSSGKILHGKTKRVREWCILQLKDGHPTSGNDTRSGGKAIDDEAFDFLFDVVGDKHKHTIDPALLGSGGEPYVLSSFFDETAKGWPEGYRRGFNRWKDAVELAYRRRKFEGETDDGFLAALLILLMLALCFVLAIAGMLLGTPNGLNCIAFIACFVGVCYAILQDDETTSIVTYSQEAVDLKAKLKALRRWLCDFTRLEEAIPTDVVLWNRLLVMATVLGVAEEVIEQLREFAPELLDNPQLEASDWCIRDREMDIGLPMSAIPMVAAASSGAYHSTSTSSTASSHDSSSSGSGGGFSSGGGGGFSGGGRGGAF